MFHTIGISDRVSRIGTSMNRRKSRTTLPADTQIGASRSRSTRDKTMTTGVWTTSRITDVATVNPTTRSMAKLVKAVSAAVVAAALVSANTQVLKLTSSRRSSIAALVC